jgi:predicted nucleic acid-binding protein
LRRERVVDASAVIKLFVEEEFSKEVRAFFKTPALRLYAPDFIYVECTNILWKYVRRFHLPMQTALQSLYKLGRLRLHPISVPPFLEVAIQLASRYDLSAYDATYASLAQGFAIPLVTADGKLSRKLKDSDIEVLCLDDPDL